MIKHSTSVNKPFKTPLFGTNQPRALSVCQYWVPDSDFLKALYWNEQYHQDRERYLSIPPMLNDKAAIEDKSQLEDKLQAVGVWPPLSQAEIQQLLQTGWDRAIQGVYFTRPVNPVPYVDRKTGQIAFLREGQYLWLQLDISTEKKTLLKKVWSVTSFFRKQARLRRARPSATLQGANSTADHWTIYEQVHDRQRPTTRLQIAKRLCGIDKNPAYDSDVKNAYARVNRAYQKAKSLVAQVYPR